jgi:hypothetical protein
MRKFKLEVRKVVNSYTTVTIEADSIGQAIEKFESKPWKYHFDEDEPVYDVTHIAPIESKDFQQWDVIGPDGISIEFDKNYPSCIAAIRAFIAWREQYKRQGYYSSTIRGRIDLRELYYKCDVIRVA